MIWLWYIPEDFGKAEFHSEFRSIVSKSLFWFKIFLIRMKNGKTLFAQETTKMSPSFMLRYQEGNAHVVL